MQPTGDYLEPVIEIDESATFHMKLVGNGDVWKCGGNVGITLTSFHLSNMHITGIKQGRKNNI